LGKEKIKKGKTQPGSERKERQEKNNEFGGLCLGIEVSPY